MVCSPSTKESESEHQAFEPFPTTKQNSHGSHRPAAMRHVDTQERRSRIDRGREEVPGTPHQALRGEVPSTLHDVVMWIALGSSTFK